MDLGGGGNNGLDSVERESKRLRVDTEVPVGPGDALPLGEAPAQASDHGALAAADGEDAMLVDALEDGGLAAMQALADLLQEEGSSDEPQDELVELSSLEALAEQQKQPCEEMLAEPLRTPVEELPEELFEGLQDAMEEAPEGAGNDLLEEAPKLALEVAKEEELASPEASPEYAPVEFPDDEPVLERDLSAKASVEEPAREPELPKKVSASIPDQAVGEVVAPPAAVAPAEVERGGESVGEDRQAAKGPSAIQGDKEESVTQPSTLNGSKDAMSEEKKSKDAGAQVKEEPTEQTKGSSPAAAKAPSAVKEEVPSRKSGSTITITRGRGAVQGGAVGLRFRCERGLPGAIAGTCSGGILKGLWRDDATGRRAQLIRYGPRCVGRIYCGRCWDEFEAVAAKPAAGAPEPRPAVSTPLPGRAGCQRWPVQACRGLAQDSLWADEASGGVFCGTCWDEFEKAGLAIESGAPEGWTQHESRSRPGMHYWFHAASGRSQFARPT